MERLWPQFLSDGKHFVYAAGAPGTVHISSIESRRSRDLMKFPVRISSLSYAPGNLFFVQDGTLFARSFDEKSLRFTGDPVSLLDGIPVTPPGMAPFSVSASGLLAGRTAEERPLFFSGSTGRGTPLWRSEK